MSTYWSCCVHVNGQLSEGKPEYTFYDGPPFATGLPHYGHLLAGTIKDTVTRYAHQVLQFCFALLQTCITSSKQTHKLTTAQSCTVEAMKRCHTVRERLYLVATCQSTLLFCTCYGMLRLWAVAVVVVGCYVTSMQMLSNDANHVHCHYDYTNQLCCVAAMLSCIIDDVVLLLWLNTDRTPCREEVWMGLPRTASRVWDWSNTRHQRQRGCAGNGHSQVRITIYTYILTVYTVNTTT